MNPANQSLDGSGLSSREIDGWLIEQPELLVYQCSPELFLGSEASHGLLEHRGVEHLDSFTPKFFGSRQGRIRVLHQRPRIDLGVVAHGNTHARGDLDVVAGDVERVGQNALDTSSRKRRLCR